MRPERHANRSGRQRRKAQSRPRPGAATNEAYEIVPMRPEDLDAVVRVYGATFHFSFLATLGAEFLRVYFATFLDYPEGCALVCRMPATGMITGFVSGSERVGRHYRQLVLSHTLDLIPPLFRATASRPRLALGLLRRMRIIGRLMLQAVFGGEPPGLPRASLMSVGVDPAYQGRGIGEALVRGFTAEMAGRGVARLKLGVRDDNVAARRLYARLGWVPLVQEIAQDRSTGWLYVTELEPRPRRYEREHARIRRVYRYYDATPVERRKRDRANPGNLAMAREREAALARTLAQGVSRPLAECCVLDLGCGWGHTLAWLHRQGVPAENLVGVDLLKDRVKAARGFYPDFRFICAAAEELDFEDSSFDVIVCMTLFSSIVNFHAARAVAATVDRLLKPDGIVLWYDLRYPNPWNPNTRPMSRRRVAEIFPGFDLRLSPITLLPPLARAAGIATPWFYALLSKLSFLRSHYQGLLRPPAQA